MESFNCVRQSPGEYRARLHRAFLASQAGRLRTVDERAVRRDFALYDKIAGPHLPCDRGAKIVDLGCGFGGFVAYLRQRGYAQACGIDISGEMVDTARRLRIEGVRQGDIRCFLAGIERQYALISAFDVIEHFDKEGVIDVLWRAYGGWPKTDA